MNSREIVTLDVTEIVDRGWTWNVGSSMYQPGAPFCSAYVMWRNENGELDCRHAITDTPQAALDAAYREAMAVHCAVCYGPLGESNGDCCSTQCEVEREARKVLA